MILAGDELGRTQHGNNNAYCQDNEISWVNWSMDEEARSMFEFAQKLLCYRRRFSILRNGAFLNGESHGNPPYRDVVWLNPSGHEMQEPDWASGKCFGMMLDSRAFEPRDSDATLLMIFNSHYEAVEFTLPKCHKIRRWFPMFNTSIPDGLDQRSIAVSTKLPITERSFALFGTTGAMGHR
jgi:glycogen operon protein